MGKVHRLVYESVVAKIPDGLTIDHLCGEKLCCNPDHMEPVTNVENAQRYWRAWREERQSLTV
jgi:hypothetical protein